MRYSNLLLLLTLPLAGCLTVPKTVRELPPVEWLQDCPLPTGTIQLNADLARQRDEAVSSLKKCNIDKASLREWAEGKTDAGSH